MDGIGEGKGQRCCCTIPNMAKKIKKQSAYVPPETVPYVLCDLVLNVALRRDQTARKLYEKMKADLTPRVFRRVYWPLERINLKKLSKRLAKEAGYDYKKGPPPGNQMVVMRNLVKAGQTLIMRNVHRLTLPVIAWSWFDRDVRKFLDDLDEFILVAFNRESDRSPDKAKVTRIKSEILTLTVLFQAYAEIKSLRIDKVAELKWFRHGKKLYSIHPDKVEEMPDLAHRELVTQSIEAGLQSWSTDKLVKIGRWWYGSRVVHDGPQAYCLHPATTRKESIDPAYLSNEIRVCDEAMGYEREKRGRRRTA